MIAAALGRLGALLGTGDSPQRTALAFAVGVWIGFSPLLGIQTLVALAVAFAFRFNKLAVLAGAYANLPWVMPAYYATATAGGAALLGQGIPADLAARIDGLMGLPGWRDQIASLLDLLRPFIWSYVAGSSLGCTLLAVISYPAALRFLRRRAVAS